MKSIHHIIVAAMDAGMPENDAERLATDLLGARDPVETLNEQIVDIEERIAVLTKGRDARQAIRDKWAGNGTRTYANIEDRESGRLRA